MNKFKVNDVVRFKAGIPAATNYPMDFMVIRAYQSHDGSFKYDLNSVDGRFMIIANLESALELK